jgi:TPR repeat protein
MLYESGTGVVKNPGTALKYWEKAAERGSAIAQQNLARRYRSGDGVPKDPAKAVEYYQKAADQENGAAMAGLAWMYRLGEGVVKDPQKALGLSQRAAAVGYSITQADLVKLYASNPSAPDPALVATWEAGTGADRMTWKVDKDGKYALDGLTKGNGTVGGSDGKLLEHTVQKEWVELSYQVQGDTLDTYGPLGPVQWKRGKGGVAAEKKDVPPQSRKPRSYSPGNSEPHHSHDWMRYLNNGGFGF